MPADFLANDFKATARAMRQEKPPQPAVLCFWGMSTLLTSVHQSVEAAVEEAYVVVASDTGVPVRIIATDGTVLMDTEALADAVIRYKEGMPT